MGGLLSSKERPPISQQDLTRAVDSLRSTIGNLEQIIVNIQRSGANSNSYSQVEKKIQNIETEVQQLGALIPTEPATVDQQDVKKPKISGEDGRYSVFINRHIENTISMYSLKDLRFVNATDDKDLLSCLQKEFPNFIVKLFISDEPLAAFDYVVVFGKYQSRIETDSNEALGHIPKGAHSKAVLIMFHKTQWSKTKEDVFEVKYTHEDVQVQLHIPYRKNSD